MSLSSSIQRSSVGLIGLAIAILPCDGLRAQSTVDSQFSSALGGIPAASHGVESIVGGFRAGGSNFRADFLRGGMTFTPALGLAAARNMPVTYRLSSIERADGTLLPLESAGAPRCDGQEVIYDHPNGIEERYQILASGVEQSFWIPERPPGEGDLIVRGRLTTELQWGALIGEEDGARLELPGVGGVRFGRVVAIDSSKREQIGSVRVVGGTIEYSLPASFVDTASYPLLIDPLIGTEIDISSGSFQDESPAIAYDGDEATYLVVWNRVFSLIDADIRGQRVSSAGVPVGGLIFISSTPNAIALAPDVASVDMRNHFVVAWQELLIGSSTYQIRAISVDPVDGTLSSSIFVSASLANQTDVAVAGDRGNVDSDALVVWDESGIGVQGRQISVDPTGGLGFTAGAVTIAADTILGSFDSPAISKSGGDDGVFLLACVFRNLITGTTAITADALDRNLTPIGTRVTVSGMTGVLDDDECAVDGDGENWVVAYSREEFAGSANRDLYCRSLRLSGSQLVFNLPEKLLNGSLLSDQSEPCVAYLGTHSIVAYRDSSFLFDWVRVESVDPYTGLRSGENFIVSALNGGSDAGAAKAPAVASQYSGGGSLVSTTSFDGALIAWDVLPVGGGNRDIYAFRYDAGTDELDLGGGCGGGGVLLTPCAFAGNGNFTARVEGAPGNSLSLFTVSGSQTAVPCGPCTLVTTLDGSQTILVGRTDSEGIASFPMAIPPAIEGTLAYAQALTFLPGGPCPMFQQVRLTNGLQITID